MSNAAADRITLLFRIGEIMGLKLASEAEYRDWEYSWYFLSQSNYISQQNHKKLGRGSFHARYF